MFDDRALALKGILLALETFQQTPAEFYPYSSKYDAFFRREASLTRNESQGLAAFNDPAKGNCARCHPSAMRGGPFRNSRIMAMRRSASRATWSLPERGSALLRPGVVGPMRTDLADKKEYCGLFRTPSLRNVAQRGVFFHNGIFHRLEDAVRFYAERDTHPQKWYPRAADGIVVKFDDLPAPYQRNLDTQAPFDRHLGDPPALTDADIRDIVAFLNTLTDGYEPQGSRAAALAGGRPR